MCCCGDRIFLTDDSSPDEISILTSYIDDSILRSILHLSRTGREERKRRDEEIGVYLHRYTHYRENADISKVEKKKSLI